MKHKCPLTTWCHSVGHWDISVFSVHIVATSSWIVPQPNAIIFHFCIRFILLNFSDVNNFPSWFLNLLQLSGEIPEPGFCHDFIGSKDCHLVQRRIGILRRWQFLADNSILTQLKNRKKQLIIWVKFKKSNQINKIV